MISVDHFTKWVEVQAITKKTDDALASFLRHSVIFQHGCPKKPLIDNGPAYAGKAFRIKCPKWGIRQYSASIYHPATNALSERKIATVKRIAKRIAEGDMAN